MEQVIVEAQIRSQHSALAQVRNIGLVPAVVYGQDGPAVSIMVPEKSLERANRTTRNLVELQIEGRAVPAFLQDIQRDAVTQRILHADFFRVDLSSKVDVRIALRLHGTERVERRGGIVQQQIRYLEVRALPSDAPEYISVDVGDLDVGGHLEVSDILLPPGVEVRTDAHVVVASVVAPKQAATVANAEAEEA